MSSPYTERPHIYFNKKYTGLHFQNVTSHPPPYIYNGNRGVDTCVHQLNNINAISGSVLVLLTSLCQVFGIPSKQIFQGGGEDIETFIPKPTKIPQFHDSGLKNIVSSVEQTLINVDQQVNDIKLSINSLRNRLQNIEDKLGFVTTLEQSLSQIDMSKIDQILVHTQSIDLKT